MAIATGSTTAAATLHASGKTDIESSAQAAEALRPIAGPLAEWIFALGIVGTGLLAIPVLAGATAYAVGEGRQWPVGLARKPKEAVAFYAVLALSGAIGIALCIFAYRLPIVQETLTQGIGGVVLPGFPMGAAVTGLLVSAAVGALAGSIPATIAVRSKVIEAIRF